VLDIAKGSVAAALKAVESLAAAAHQISETDSIG
jgi:hypothetical protein